MDNGKYKKIILLFGGIILKLDLGNDTVNRFWIEKAYSVAEEETPYGLDLKINVDVPITCQNLEIPIAYSLLQDATTSLNIYEINKYISAERKSGECKIIEFKNSPHEAEKYINFSETGYLVGCTTRNGAVYRYTAIVRINSGRIVMTITDGDSEFNKSSKGKTVQLSEKLDEYNELYKNRFGNLVADSNDT